MKVAKGQDPYNVIGNYIREHLTVIEDMIAVIRINDSITNELFLVDWDEEGCFVWHHDWWEGEENVELIDFFPVSDSERLPEPEKSDFSDLDDRPSARWISVGHKRARICSRCFGDEPYKFADYDADVYGFCPHCGAKMLNKLPSAETEQQNARIFQGIIVEYPTISTYPECEGKPYFSIKYTENGQEYIGYGTYKPEVLSEYLKEYFMPSAEPEQIARDIATIIENEQDMRVISKNAEHTETHSCDCEHTETHESCTDCPLYDHDKHNCPRFNRVIPATIEAAKPRWIAVEEALPEDDKRVLCQMKGGELVFGFHHGKYWAYGHKPIAWFPLPEPYKEGQE